MSSTSNEPTRQSRIPFALQAVFLASNRGKEVHKPPPDNAGFKVFFGNWFLQRNTKKATKVLRDERSTNARKKEEEDAAMKPISPQVYLDLLLRSRGYSTKRYETLKTAYYSSPTPLQQASYDLYLVGLVKKNDLVALSDAISCGLSPNPCNKYGESLAHMVCRRGNTPMLQLLLQNGASLQIGDDYGRTPLHDACWAAEPSFETVQVVLQADARLLHMIDARGHVPLNYVREHHWSQWIEFIDEQKDVFWPPLETTQGPPPLALQPPNTFSLPDPSRAMPLELAKMVASGKMTPEDVRIMYPEKFDDDIATVITSSAHDWDDDSDSDYDSEEEEDDSMDDDDLNALLSELPIR